MRNFLRNLIGISSLTSSNLKFKFAKGSTPPTRSNDAVGYDIYYDGPNVTLEPGKQHIFKTGYFSEFDHGWVALIQDRSGLGARGLKVLGGVIDPDYRGEWGVILQNTSKLPFVIGNGHRIAQFLMLRCDVSSFERVESLSDTERGDGSYGSTGK